ncbi:MAG: MBL fold metallo-hydrolase [Anaerolineae bacterium]|nr:MBL fold metallo-hydrolase [Anaerolineae bacterium]
MALPPIQRFESSGGVRLYRIPVEAFPGFIAYAYIVLGAGEPTLVDTGSGMGNSNEQLIQGIESLQVDFNEPLAVKDIRRIIITHGHIDHFGGVSFMIEQTDAPVAVHPIDRRVLTAHEERVVVATKDLRVYLERAGVKRDFLPTLIEMYQFARQHVHNIPVSILLDEDTPLDGMRFIHTPGHCPGQVCIQIDDALLSADHILSRTTPNQSPESITRYSGLGHYFESLQKVERLDGIRLALGGHEDPITDVYGRIREIRASHQRKLDRALDAIRGAGKPQSLNDISRTMYPNRKGYDILLALSEVGAHVEYLYERGHLAVCNLDEVEREPNPALLYAVI